MTQEKKVLYRHMIEERFTWIPLGKTLSCVAMTLTSGFAVHHGSVALLVASILLLLSLFLLWRKAVALDKAIEDMAYRG